MLDQPSVAHDLMEPVNVAPTVSSRPRSSWPAVTAEPDKALLRLSYKRHLEDSSRKSGSAFFMLTCSKDMVQTSDVIMLCPDWTWLPAGFVDGSAKSTAPDVIVSRSTGAFLCALEQDLMQP